jgi:hypothetical protein
LTLVNGPPIGILSGRTGKPVLKFPGLLRKFARIGFLEFGKILQLPPDGRQMPSGQNKIKYYPCLTL